MRYLFAFIVFIFSSSAFGQGYPTRPIKMVVPFAPGCSADTIARPLADHLGRQLNQPIIISNRGGGVGAPGTAFALAAKPDGYTILFTFRQFLPLLKQINCSIKTLCMN